MERTEVMFIENWVAPDGGVLLKETDTLMEFDDYGIDSGTLYVDSTQLTWIGNEDGKGICINRDLIDSYEFEKYLDNFLLHINMKATVDLPEYFQRDDGAGYKIDKLDEISFRTFDEVAKERMSEAMKQLLPSHPALSANGSEDKDDGDKLEYSE